MEITLLMESRSNKKGLHALKAYVYKSRDDRKYIPLGYHIKYNHFDFENNRVRRINRQAGEIHRKFEKIRSDLLNEYGIDDIKKRHLTNNFLFSYLSEEYLIHLKSDHTSFNTKQNFICAFSTIKAYQEDFDVNTISQGFIRGFVKFCNKKPLKNGESKKLATTTINSYLSRMNSFYSWLHKTHGVKQFGDLFMGVKESEPAARNKAPKYFTPELITEFFNKMRSYSILEHDFTKNQFLAAASWLFMYYSFGTRIGDLYRLRFNAFREKNNKLVLTYKAQKTQKETNNIILKDKAIFILRLFLPQKYLWEYLMSYPNDYLAWWCFNGSKSILKGGDSLFGNDLIQYDASQTRFIKMLILEQAIDYGKQYLIPNIPIDLEKLPDEIIQQRINERRNTNSKALKKMLKILGLPAISFHGSRHSFACKLINKEGVKPIEIQDALNHSHFSTTNNYISQFKTEESREMIANIVNED